jgi:uncharacterized protein (DUF2267 family)
MNRDEFLGKVRERGEYADRAETERVTRTVLAALGRRLGGGEANHLAAQLPADLADAVRSDDTAETYGEQEFLRRLSEQLDATEETARWDASAVLSTVAEAVTGGQLNQLLTQLPSGYAELFGKPELS